MKYGLSILLVVCLLNIATAGTGQSKHSFGFGQGAFLLDGKPFRIISGEMHPARIPREYWRHRIRMAKAMGCNTIAAYFFWNYHESAPGQYDFTTGSHDLGAFMRIVQEEGMWLLVRPGPYVCAEWDFGGIPPYLLSMPDIRVRCRDARFMRSVESYIHALAPVVRPFQVTEGGPVLMLQIENEYGSYGNDKAYLEDLRACWKKNGIAVAFYTADGASPAMLEAGSLPGAAIGLDSGSDSADFAQAAKHDPSVPAFSSETYPGWLTHWGEQWARPDTAALMKEVRFLLSNGKSFNFYVIHGGTNFGFSAGANSGGKGFEPDVTSYDYDAPIDEQGRPTPKYIALRSLIAQYAPDLPPIPPPVPARAVPKIRLEPFASLWRNLPRPVRSAQPQTFEANGLAHGIVVYRTRLLGQKSGTLTISDVHDYATVFLNGRFIGTVDRRLGEKTIDLPPSDVRRPVLEILVEAMGRINYGQAMIDRKGITERVTLNGMTLMNWEMYLLPLDEHFVRHLRPSAPDTSRRGTFFRGDLVLEDPADTFLDMTRFRKGIVWVNGRNLGRFWEVGPQKRLYCPGVWLRKGSNEIIAFDLLRNDGGDVQGFERME